MGNQALRPFQVTISHALLACLIALSAILASPPPAPAAPEKKLAAFYFYWYEKPTLHWIDPDGSDALTEHPPDAYVDDPQIAYSYNDPAWHRRELLDLIAARVDITLPVYWGDYTNRFWSQPGLEKLVEATQRLINEGRPGVPRLGMFFDTTSLMIENGGAPADLTSTAGKAMFYGMIEDFFERVPEHLWAAFDGRPLIYLYVSSYAQAYNQSTFDYIYTHFENEFDVRPFIVREVSWQGVQTDGVYAWGAAVVGPNVFNQVGSIGPGYDDRAVWGRDVKTVRERECGEFYITGWETILDSAARLVTLETWNEFHEGTVVCPSREYARQYLDLTAENAWLWKQTDITSRPFIWLDLGSTPYGQGLHPAFNGGDGTWKTAYLGEREAAYPDLASQPDPSHHIYLSVSDNFIYATPTEVWVTVEYYDGGDDGWFLEYDAVGDGIPAYYQDSPWVSLEDSGRWKRETFHFTDAYFAGRQNGGADLRLVDGYDGVANYFGRVWISRYSIENRPPDLTGLADLFLPAGRPLDIPLHASDPDGVTLAYALDRSPGFSSLVDAGGGKRLLRLKPSLADLRPCPYPLRLLVYDGGDPALADAATIEISLVANSLYLPVIRRASS